MKKSFLVFPLLALSTICCAFDPLPLQVTVVLPQVPPPYTELAQIDGWYLRYPGPDAHLLTTGPYTGSQATLELPKMPWVPLTALPYSRDAALPELPWGVLVRADEQVAVMQAADGLSITCLQDLHAAGFQLGHFNCSRFVQTLRDKAAGQSCWSLDKTRMMHSLVEGFRSDQVRALPASSCLLSLPTGTWQPLDSQQASLVCVDNTAPMAATFSTGHHVFLHHEGLLRMDVWVADDGRFSQRVCGR